MTNPSAPGCSYRYPILSADDWSAVLRMRIDTTHTSAAWTILRDSSPRSVSDIRSEGVVVPLAWTCSQVVQEVWRDRAGESAATISPKTHLQLGERSYALPIEKAIEIGQFQALANSLEDLNLPLEDHVQFGAQCALLVAVTSSQIVTRLATAACAISPRPIRGSPNTPSGMACTSSDQAGSANDAAPLA